ncbi:MAG: hypothetical protein H0X63_11575 [Flavobacteriales bacterium]|nr:hypothetical protein [Flavobacteriales bacterium]
MSKYLIILLLISFSSEEKETLVIDAFSSATYTEIPLNDGKKWEANKETTESIFKMIVITKEAIDSETYEPAEVRATLETELQMLLKNCTIEGPARTQLHNYQLGLRYRMDAIKKEVETLKNVQTYLEKYHTYFE